MLSLSPRYDLFKFNLPRDFLPGSITEKWSRIINREPGVLTTPIDVLNESIKSISIPAISDLLIQQSQHSYNKMMITESPQGKSLGRINVEAKQDNTSLTTNNPLDKIPRELKVTFRLNQGFTNYFMMFEYAMMQANRAYDVPPVELMIDLLSETGEIFARITLSQCAVDGIDGLELSYDKVDRSADTFDITWKFNNIDYSILEKY